ncbi:MAG: hypothetical protein JHC76_03380 [Akkermansiaceae bacterium]|nr:hypothetical protein [Akkermansiaceae bacterium]MBJ7395063.1 hypothetical protein [Akkermansiaceae bacterium]
MRHVLTIFLLLVTNFTQAEEAPSSPKSSIPATTLLPDGSKLKGMMVPRYDENHILTSVLRSDVLTLVNDDQFEGETVRVEFLNPDQTPKGRIDLITATFYQSKRLLTTQKFVKIKSDQMHATGSGLYYAFGEGKGFLLGPVTTILKITPKNP